MYSLIRKLITQTAALKTKINRLNKYWTTLQEYSITTSNVHSTCTISAANCWLQIQGNILMLQISHTVSSSISSGTSVKRTICNISFEDTEHLLDWSQVPSSANGTLSGSGPISTYQVNEWTTDGNGTYTAQVVLGGTAGGAMSTSTNFLPRFICVVARNI